MAESMSDDELMAALGQSSAASLSDEELLSRLNVPRGTAETPTNMTPAVAEGVSAVNRGIVAIPDFVIDAVNAPIQAAGFDPIPNATELIRRIEPRFAQEGFMEPGLARDVIQAAGETAPIALGVGTAVRQAASALPNIVRGGESVGRGALRQSVTTPAEDIATGALAGAGAEVGEEVGGRIGGETGAQVGRLAGAVAAPASLAAISPATATAREINNALRQSSPALNTLRQQSDDLYRQIDGLGVAFKQPAVAQLADDIERELVKSGLDENLTPKTFQLLSRIRSDAERPLTATEVDTLRKLASVPASDVDDIGKATLDSRLGTKVIEKLDDFLSSPQQNILTGRGEVGPLFSQARKLVAQRKKGERLAEAFNKASLQASGFENGLRVQFRSILNSPSKRRGFNQEELAMMRKVVEGGKLENAARILGKFGLSLDLSGGGFLAGVTALGGLIAGGGLGGLASAAFVGLASGAKQAARVMTKNNADLAAAFTRAGPNARKIVGAYIQNVPKAQRNPEDLAGLLLEARVPIPQLNALTRNRSDLIANASYAASVLSQVEDPTEDEVQPNAN